MKKHLIVILFSIISCLIIFAVAVKIILTVWDSGVFLYDHSAKICLEYVSWNGKEYSNIGGVYTEGRTLARGKDGWKIKMVEEDPSHTFIVARGFLDQALLVSDDYDVPASGTLTAVSWNGVYITDSLFLDAVSKIDAEKMTSFTYQTDGIYIIKENQYMNELYFAYENCPVATNYKGYMGKVNGEWVITTYISEDTRNYNGSPKSYPVSCYRIPSEYWDILSEYLS